MSDPFTDRRHEEPDYIVHLYATGVDIPNTHRANWRIVSDTHDTCPLELADALESIVDLLRNGVYK